MDKYKKNLKILAVFLGCLLIRLIPFRAPNIEPVLSAQMPLSKTSSKIKTFAFGLLSIVLYDILTSKIGIWTIYTGVTYGIIGLLAQNYFKNREGSVKNYVSFAIMGTILYDTLTGVVFGPIFFAQSFSEALFGQIPFTLLHLLGNISFAVCLSPLIYLFLKKETAVNYETRDLCIKRVPPNPLNVADTTFRGYWLPVFANLIEFRDLRRLNKKIINNLKVKTV